MEGGLTIIIPKNAPDYFIAMLEYIKQRDYENALKYGRKAEEQQSKSAGDSNEDMAYIRNALGVVLAKLDRSNEAIEVLNSVISVVMDKSDVDSAAVFNNMARISYEKCDYETALKWFEKALAIEETVLGKDHPDTAETYNSMAVVYSKQGNYDKALELYGKALAIRETVLGKNHPKTEDAAALLRAVDETHIPFGDEFISLPT